LKIARIPVTSANRGQHSR